jgi:hypothetical protein
MLCVAFAVASPPSAVAAGKVRVACQDLDGPGVVYRVRPSACSFTCASCDWDIAGTYLFDLRWKRWGRAVTRANGTFGGNGGYEAPARIRLRGRRLCDGRRYYSKGRLVTGGSPVNFALPTPC